MKHAKQRPGNNCAGKWAQLLVAAMLLACPVTGCQTTSNALPMAEFITEKMPINAEIKGDKYYLDGLMIRPKGDGPFPLAILTHGSCGKSCRQTRSPGQLQAQANVFARWGYAAFILMRRDNGISDGPYAEGYRGCKIQDYERAARATAQDLSAAIQLLGKQAFVDGGRVIAVGQSGGGIGVIALASEAVPGLRAAINFAGGRGGTCIRRGTFKHSKIVEAYRSFGRGARVTTLWVYTKNDGSWGPRQSRAWRNAFVDGGGKATYILLPAYGSNGHRLFYKDDAIPIWTPAVSKFLRRAGLPAGN